MAVGFIKQSQKKEARTLQSAAGRYLPTTSLKKLPKPSFK